MAALPALPPKALLVGPVTLAARALAFEAFLRAVGADAKLRLLPAVAAFVGATARPARRQGRSCSSACGAARRGCSLWRC